MCSRLSISIGWEVGTEGFAPGKAGWSHSANVLHGRREVLALAWYSSGDPLSAEFCLGCVVVVVQQQWHVRRAGGHF